MNKLWVLWHSVAALEDWVIPSLCIPSFTYRLGRIRQKSWMPLSLITSHTQIPITGWMSICWPMWCSELCSGHVNRCICKGSCKCCCACIQSGKIVIDSVAACTHLRIEGMCKCCEFWDLEQAAWNYGSESCIKTNFESEDCWIVSLQACACVKFTFTCPRTTRGCIRIELIDVASYVLLEIVLSACDHCGAACKTKCATSVQSEVIDRRRFSCW